MGKYIIVQGCTLECTPAATAQIATSPSTTTKADGKACYRGSLTINVTKATAVTDGNGAGTGVITGSAQEVRIDGQPAVLEGDKIQITVSGTSGGNPASGTVIVKISQAGQTYVSAS